MQLWFVDDARQLTPTRRGDRSVVCSWSDLCLGANLRSFENALDTLCRSTGFPDGQEFKWSPGRALWMRDNLSGEARTEFFLNAVAIARDHGICGTLTVVDTNHTVITGASNHETAVVRLLLERIQVPAFDFLVERSWFRGSPIAGRICRQAPAPVACGDSPDR